MPSSDNQNQLSWLTLKLTQQSFCKRSYGGRRGSSRRPRLRAGRSRTRSGACRRLCTLRARRSSAPYWRRRSVHSPCRALMLSGDEGVHTADESTQAHDQSWGYGEREPEHSFRRVQTRACTTSAAPTTPCAHGTIRGEHTHLSQPLPPLQLITNAYGPASIPGCFPSPYRARTARPRTGCLRVTRRQASFLHVLAPSCSPVLHKSALRGTKRIQTCLYDTLTYDGCLRWDDDDPYASRPTKTTMVIFRKSSHCLSPTPSRRGP